MKVAVMGGGNGAHAMAADLSLGGFEVHMCELPEFRQNVEPVIKKSNQIEISGVATAWRKEGSNVAKVKVVTTDVKEAIKGVDLINVVTPAFGHEPFYRAMAPYLKDGQIIVSHPGNYGALVFANMLKKMGIKKDVILADTATLVYTCRKVAPGHVKINGFKALVRLAALPAKSTPKALKAIDQAIPGRFKAAKNVIEIGLLNSNPQFHVPIMMLNAGRVEDTKGDFLFYIQGATPSVSRVIEVMSEERIAVGKALGLTLTHPKDDLRDMYGAKGKSLYEAFQDTKPYWDKDCESAPAVLTHRYVSEDAPFGLVPLTSIGKLLGVPTPVSNLMVDLASLINQTDYRRQGLTTEKLGLTGLTANEITRMVEG